LWILHQIPQFHSLPCLLISTLATSTPKKIKNKNKRSCSVSQCVTVRSTVYPLSTLLYLQIQFHCNYSLVCFKASGYCYTINTDPHQDSSWISCCPVSWSSCSFGSAGPAPSHAQQFIDEVDTEVDRLRGLDLGQGGSWIDQPIALPHPYHQGQLSGTCLVNSSNTIASKGQGQLSHSHALGAISPTPMPPWPSLLFCPGEVWVHALLSATASEGLGQLSSTCVLGASSLEPLPQRPALLPAAGGKVSGEGISPSPMPPYDKEVPEPALPCSHPWGLLTQTSATRSSSPVLPRQVLQINPSLCCFYQLFRDSDWTNY
jgi:hypothetical protein